MKIDASETELSWTFTPRLVFHSFCRYSATLSLRLPALYE